MRLNYIRGGYRISIKGALIIVMCIKILKPHPLFVKPRPFKAHSWRKSELRVNQKQSVYARMLSKGKLQQGSFSTWLERGLDFVHIHYMYFLNRILAKRGSNEPLKPAPPPPPPPRDLPLNMYILTQGNSHTPLSCNSVNDSHLHERD